MLCGIAETAVTPRIGSGMPGYLDERKATHVIDDVYAKAFAVSNCGITLVVVALDILDVEGDFVDAIRVKTGKETGVPAGNIMVCSTHTHTGPPAVDSFATNADPEYVSGLVEIAAGTAAKAVKNARPARIGWGQGRQEGISFNRRYFMLDGSVATNPGACNPLIKGPAGPVDPEVAVLRIDDADGHPMGALVNFACHLDTIGGTGVSPDYAGALSSNLKEMYGKDFVCIFLNGASGNINHIDVSGKVKRELGLYKQMGRKLAAEAVRVLDMAETYGDVPVGSCRLVFDVRGRSISEAELAEAEKTVNSADAGSIAGVFANELLLLSRARHESYSMEVQAFRLGELALTGLPGDVFAELGLSIKESSTFRHNMISTHTNLRGGYIPTREAFAQGGYEVKTTRSNRLEHGAGELLVQKAVQALKLLC